MGEVSGEEAQLRGSGEVDEVRLEAMEGVFNGVRVAPEEGVEGEIFFHADGGGGARKLKDFDGS
jgi:hypothetical protein